MLLPDDLSREVYCVLGMPVDAIDMAAALRRIEAAAAGTQPFWISTPNLNFLANSLSDPDFRESLLLSDLCTADGMPILWIARLLGIPIKERLPGSGIFEELCAANLSRNPLTVFLFGGSEGAADSACRALNSEPGALKCVGSTYPGYGGLDDLSSEETIEAINSSDAQFLTVALGATKGQAWLRRNHDRLHIPVRAHLGAAINFRAGTVRRAPRTVQKLGLEWLWRIKEEPRLWRRYWIDGCTLLRLLFTRVLPLAIRTRWDRRRGAHRQQDLRIKISQDQRSVIVGLGGDAVERHIDSAIARFRVVLAMTRELILVDMSEVSAIDPRFLGLALMMRKCVERRGKRLKFVGVSPSMQRWFRLNEVAFLLSTEGTAPC